MSKLNANAKPFVPAPTQRAEAAQQLAQLNVDERSLFMTFSNGSPVTRQEIFQHFTSTYGQCVENVYVHRSDNRDPEFGKIIFTTLDWPRIILENNEIVKISINGKPIWLKKYIPKSRRSNS